MEIRISTTREAEKRVRALGIFFFILLLLLLLLHACPLYSMFFSVFLLLWFFFLGVPPFLSVPCYNVIRVYSFRTWRLSVKRARGIKTSTRFWTRAVRLSRFTRFRRARYTGPSLLYNTYHIHLYILVICDACLLYDNMTICIL